MASLSFNSRLCFRLVASKSSALCLDSSSSVERCVLEVD